jgi:hypothetical protein
MTERDDLPLPDYDHLPLGSLMTRIRSLNAGDLQSLIQYERSHANRVQVVTVMDNRLRSLREGAQPSGGDPSAPTPEAPPSPDGRSKVSAATTGPPINPPSQGDPTNPAQPR